MAGLTGKDAEIVLTSLEEQGCTLVPRKDGTLIRFPDGGTHMIHRSESEHRGWQNNRAAIRRHGMQWPFDGQNRRKARTVEATKVRRRTWREVHEIVENAARGVVDSEGRLNPGDIERATGLNTSSILSHLHRLGWEPESRGVWRVPTVEEPVPEAENVVAADVVVRASGVATANGSLKREREFIDSEDSWVVDFTRPLLEQPLHHIVAAYRAAGLNVEIRVWKEPTDGRDG